MALITPNQRRARLRRWTKAQLENRHWDLFEEPPGSEETKAEIIEAIVNEETRRALAAQQDETT